MTQRQWRLWAAAPVAVVALAACGGGGTAAEPTPSARAASASELSAQAALVEILSYRESHGGEIRLPAWRRQFVGKTAQSALRVGDDIANISGATLSCNHVTDGVRRIVAVVQAARTAGGLA